MDDYGVKFSAMQHYVPFLDKMIKKLEKCRDREKQAQLQKMRSLYGILTDPSKKVRFDVLVKCEEVLKKLYEKVEGSGEESGYRKSRSNTPRSPSPDRESEMSRPFYPGEQQGRFSRKVGLLGDAPPPSHRDIPADRLTTGRVTGTRLLPSTSTSTSSISPGNTNTASRDTSRDLGNTTSG